MNPKDIDWKEIKQKMKELITLEKNKKEKYVKLIMTGTDDVREDEMVGKMLQGEEQIRQTINQFVAGGEEIDCDIIINEDEKFMMITFKEEKWVKKTFDFFEDMFYGDFLKKMVEAMMEAFKGMGDAFKNI